MTTKVADEHLAAHESKPRFRFSAALRLVLAAASGFVFYLSFAPRPLWWLAPIAFLGLGVALAHRRFWGGFGVAFVFGLAFYLPLLTWLQDFLGSDFGPWPWLALSAALALYYGLVGGLITWAAKLPAAPLWMAFIVIAAETPRAWFPLGGFPWGRVAFSQPEGAFLSLASLGGAPLVGFAVVVTGFGAAAIAMRMYNAKKTSDPATSRYRQFFSPTLCTALPLVLGLIWWSTIDTAPEDGTRTVAVVQGSAPDTGLGMLTQGVDLRRTHLDETQELIRQVHDGKIPQPDLMVWPETATELRSGRTPDPELAELIAELNAPALIGAVYNLPGGGSENALIAWDPQTGPGERYTKQQLVPFGEYIPAKKLAEAVTPFIKAVDERVPGKGEPPVLTIAGTKVGAMICYEAAYDYPARNAVLAGAELLTAPTNNAWYGHSEMTYQQLAMSRLRAVEHGRAVVVSATTGVSAIVQPDGAVAGSTGLFTPALLDQKVPLRTTITLADRLGSSVEYGIVCLALIGVLGALVLRRRASTTLT